ncbi:hypothetical protein O3M35_009077 [Rhynocoris fuscipes]|uniref:Lipocalin/cytosolic fatty-acid binding domain-containing protein n=1 Tax=Rhynocoris fuscipes TaxID=488301 RepID=A0AAW1D2W1_9HEMI
MKALGVGLIGRKMANSVSPVLEIFEENGEYTFKHSSTFKDTIMKFKIGEETEQETPDGRKVKTIVTVEGDNKLVEVQKGDKQVTIIREFSKDQVKMTYKVNDVVCTRIYQVIQ